MISLVLPSNKYLIEQRKLNEEVINTFALSYCDEQGEIYVTSDCTRQFPILSKAFHHSTLFPIQSIYGDIVGVSARPLHLIQNGPKYVNTVFEKSEHLYGLNTTYNDILKEQKVYVVEGNISMLTPWKNGIKNICAMLGSSISHTQLCLLNRFAKKVVFVPDNDKAGKGFISKIKENIPKKFYDSDLEFYFIELPQGQDPDNYFQTHSKEEFLKLEERKLNS